MKHHNRIMLLVVLLSVLLLLPEFSAAYHLAQHQHHHDEPCQICTEITMLITNRSQLLATTGTLALAVVAFVAVLCATMHAQVIGQKTLVSLNMKLTN